MTPPVFFWENKLGLIFFEIFKDYRLVLRNLNVPIGLYVLSASKGRQIENCIMIGSSNKKSLYECSNQVRK